MWIKLWSWLCALVAAAAIWFICWGSDRTYTGMEVNTKMVQGDVMSLWPDASIKVGSAYPFTLESSWHDPLRAVEDESLDWGEPWAYKVGPSLIQGGNWTAYDARGSLQIVLTAVSDTPVHARVSTDWLLKLMGAVIVVFLALIAWIVAPLAGAFIFLLVIGPFVRSK